jgi:2-methylisocitrate lyase-like PEP mutase family enzyme
MKGTTSVTTSISKPAMLRKLLADDTPVVAPGVYDALTARLVERAGFSAALVSGAAVSASLLGRPDLGFLSLAESLAQTRNIVLATDIPIIADCDTGYGGAVTITRTIPEFEAAGAAGVFFEDQVTPKRCGHFERKAVVEIPEMVGKIRAAIDARRNADFVIIARTDARATAGLDEAIRRMEAYAAAGADLVFVEAPESEEELALVAERAPVPLMVNLVEGGRTPLLSVARLGELGFRLVTYSGSLQKVAIKAMQDALAYMGAHGDVAGIYPDRMVSLGERSEILDLPRYEQLEDRYRA